MYTQEKHRKRTESHDRDIFVYIVVLCNILVINF